MGSTTLNRQVLTDTSMMGIVTDKLGTTSGDFSSDTDIGKGVKLAANAYVVLTAGDEIEGIINSVEPGTRSGGYSWGGIQTRGRALATVGANQESTVTVGNYVCADAQIAPGTAGLVQVMDTDAGVYVAPTKFLWRIIRIVSGTGVAGDSVLIERV